jgi:hypothetical protein|tara:strand:+ start:404 stop:508 length:105 start_codon:yes stop_codon:yes gene_type:complete
MNDFEVRDMKEELERLKKVVEGLQSHSTCCCKEE